MLHKQFRITDIQCGNNNLMAIPITFQHVGDGCCKNEATLQQSRKLPDVTKHVGELPDVAQHVADSAEQIRELPRALSDLGSVHFVDKTHLLKSKVVTPQQKLFNYCSTFLDKEAVKRRISAGEMAVLVAQIPSKWEIHGDLVMFSEQAFFSLFWKSLDKVEGGGCYGKGVHQFWKDLADTVGAKRVALSSRIVSDNYRTPSVEIMFDGRAGLVGDGVDGWVEHVDNGVRYTYDVTRNMFSKGNITEKLRISKWDCRGEVVVDMFAGMIASLFIQDGPQMMET